MIRIFRIDLQNCNNYPLVNSFACHKVIDPLDLKWYKKRLKLVFERRYNKQLTVILRYVDVKSKYDEKIEQLNETK